jgi:hypothetical protein
MSNSEPSSRGADWTRLLADPDLATHLGELLQAYRDAPPAERERALLATMRKIKLGAAAGGATQEGHDSQEHQLEDSGAVTAAASPAPPFEPSIFTPSWAGDRRRYPRMKCFVVVELRINGSETPVWGNLANTSIGGCFVETPSALSAGAKIEIGLWISSGQVWVKGYILNGVVAHNNPSFGLRIKFAEMETSERESLRQFLKYVETSTKGYFEDHGYLAQLKR